MFKLKKYENNPILAPLPDSDWESACVLNPAVVYDDKENSFVMVYRAAGHDKQHIIRLGLAKSKDGIHFERDQKGPVFDVDKADADGGCVEDPRLVKLGGTYFMCYAARAYAPGQYWLLENQNHVMCSELPGEVLSDDAPYFAKENKTVSYLAMTHDFVNYKRLGRITDARYDDRDVMLFPEKVGGKYVRISRPKYGAKCKYGSKMPSIWLSFSEDLLEYDETERLMTGEQWWENARIGAACPPIKTEKGWFMLYHGVAESDEQYRVGAVLLDLEDPLKIVSRTKDYLMEPEFDYETKGFYNGCVFPTGNVVRDGVLYVYYGCADKFIALATANFDELVDYLYRECRV